MGEAVGTGDGASDALAGRRPAAAAGGPKRWRRGLAFRLGAIVLGLVPFAAAETAFVLLDWGRPGDAGDPFMGFSAIRPLFVPSADGTRYEVARSRLAFFRPESFAARKGPDEYRVFCLGGSTVQGRPFAIETSFTTWLEMNLKLADPTRRWEVVNCGGISYASYRLVPILREVLAHGADLVILYTGHNEFLEDREYGHIRDMPKIVTGPCELVMRTRTYALLRRAYVHLRGADDRAAEDDRPVLGPEVDAMLDHKGGLAKYHRDEQWRRGVIEHYCCNVARMVRIARDAGVGMLLVNPASNLRDCPPFKSQHRDGLTAEERERWESLCHRANRRLADGPAGAVELLRRAETIDDQHAGLHYFLGKCLDAAGRPAEAREAYLRAKELDICPLRMLEPMHLGLLEIARRSDTPLVDARGIIEARSEDGIAGGYLLVDHVHPSIAGHRLIADALIDELVRRGIVRARDGWRDGREAKVRQYIDSLGDLYFAKGIRRLEALRGWAAGRVADTIVGPPPEAGGPSGQHDPATAPEPATVTGTDARGQ